jgi:hypothetical protein
MGGKIMARIARGVSAADLFGGRFISPRVVQHSMAELEKRLTAEFNERDKTRRQHAQAMAKIRRPLAGLLGKDQSVADGVKGLRKLQAAAANRKLSAPPVAMASERIFAGSIGATRTPPYDYQWTWSAVSGSTDENREVADLKSGRMSVQIWTGDNDSSSISGRSAVGIYFYPPLANGHLQIWSTPGLSYNWGDWCTFDGASVDGWIGLYVGSYDLAGGFTGAPIDQQTRLWSDSSWWNGVGGQQGSNSGLGLYAPPIQVDNDHQYLIWAWMGGDVSAAGWHTGWGSAAGNEMFASVPSITWEMG